MIGGSCIDQNVDHVRRTEAEFRIEAGRQRRSLHEEGRNVLVTERLGCLQRAPKEKVVLHPGPSIDAAESRQVGVLGTCLAHVAIDQRKQLERNMSELVERYVPSHFSPGVIGDVGAIFERGDEEPSLQSGRLDQPSGTSHMHEVS